jgi:LPS-assembly protein
MPLTSTDTVPRPANARDTTPPRVDSVRRDSAGNVIRTVDSIDVKISKDSLDAPVSYSASDSMVLDVPSKIITLYSKANVKQKDIVLDADRIELDQQKEMMTAIMGGKDSAGLPIGLPKFVQGDNTMIADTILFNTRTQKGFTKNTYTQQGGEFFVNAFAMKKINATDYYAYRGRFTTCDLDTPHFAFRTQKMKLVNKKLAVSGPIHPEFEGVPIPFYIPFGFFPLSQGRHSGLLPPQFTANDQFGLGLEGLGYYKVLNDNFDVIVRGDIYSYGGYRVNLTPTYRVRYRYQGSLTFSYQNSRILSDFGKSEFSSTRTFNISWSHSVDSRARPGQTFSASVNAGSTKFNQFITNNPYRNFQNQLNSSIAYSKNWDNKYNLTVTANHNQNNNTRLVNLNLPTVGFTVTNFYPFQRKDFAGEPKWYEKLGIGLNTNFANQLSFYDSLVSFRRLIDTLQWGAQHSIPITLSLPSLGPIQIAPGVSYRENWYNMRTYRRWDPKTNTVIDSSKKGFYRAGDVSFSLGLNTAIFGTYEKFGKNSKIVAFRHVMRPTLSLNYNPAIAKGDYYDAQVDSLGHTMRYSYYDRTMFGALTGQEFGGMSFGIDNNIEIKVRDKKDTTEGGIKKIKLIDGFGFNGSYNFIADSFKLSTFSLYVRSTLFEKINITAGANLDPYVIDSFGFRRDKLVWSEKKFSLGRLTSGNVSISTSFQSKSKDKDKDKDKKEEESGSAFNQFNRPMTLEEQQAQLQYVRNNPAEFADFNIPWSVNLSYSLSFSRDFIVNQGFKTTISSSVNISGDFNLTPKWKAGLSTYYDFRGSGLQNVTGFVSREMHCWQMSINIYSGMTRGFNITINPKSGFLRDLKINRSRYFYNNL